jgi:hypothetical protein
MIVREVNTVLGMPVTNVAKMNQSSRASSEFAKNFEENLKSTIAPEIIPKLTAKA